MYISPVMPVPLPSSTIRFLMDLIINYSCEIDNYMYEYIFVSLHIYVPTIEIEKNIKHKHTQ
jgi:hypothetical protein